MTGPFSLDDAALHSLSQVHGEVSDGLGHLNGPHAPHSGVVPESFGHIASSMNQALGATLEMRGGTFETTQRSCDTIAGHLKQAHSMYMGAAENVAQDITKGFDDVAAGGHGDLHGANGVHGAQGAADDPAGAGAGSSGTPLGASSGTPAGATHSGGPSSGTDAPPPGAPTSALPTSAQDASGGIGGAAAIGQSLGQTLGQSAQQVDAAGQAAGQGVQAASHTQGHSSQQQAASGFGGVGGEHGAIGASAHTAQELGHRSGAPAGPDDDAADTEPPGDDSDTEPPDDDQLPDDQPAQPPAPPRPNAGRADPRKP